MSRHKTLTLDQGGNADPDEVTDAIDLASDQDQPTWIVDASGGKVAAIVPVEVLEQYDAWAENLLRPSFSPTFNSSAGPGVGG